MKLDFNKDYNVQYCIPDWVKNEQVERAVKRGLPNLEGPLPKRHERIALVCYGPSLNDTWHHLKKFKWIMTCSGSHKFLIERGIVPTWHAEVDPRPHKIQLLGAPHPDVEYLVASACCPDYFDHLQGFNVKLWHVFSNEEEAFRLMPPNSWAITGGSSVGLRTMSLAWFLGFRNFHIFGMDGSSGESGLHGAKHPNQQKDLGEVEYNGRTFLTTAAFLLCAKQTFHELNQLKDVTAKFYGDGLVQHMAKDYVKEPAKDTVFIGLSKEELISADYRAQNAQLHHENIYYGVGGGKHVDTVLKLVEKCQTHSVLDYGCGKGYLAKALPFPIWEYDPAIEGKDGTPRAADIVVCTDVLEHVEPDKLDFVLGDLARCTRKVGYFVIHTGAAGKTLPDGRNTHLIQEKREWWENRLAPFFQLAKVFEVGPELYVVVAPRKIKRKAA